MQPTTSDQGSFIIVGMLQNLPIIHFMWNPLLLNNLALIQYSSIPLAGGAIMFLHVIFFLLIISKLSYKQIHKAKETIS